MLRRSMARRAFVSTFTTDTSSALRTMLVPTDIFRVPDLLRLPLACCMRAIDGDSPVWQSSTSNESTRSGIFCLLLRGQFITSSRPMATMTRHTARPPYGTDSGGIRSTSVGLLGLVATVNVAGGDNQLFFGRASVVWPFSAMGRMKAAKAANAAPPTPNRSQYTPR